MQADIIVHISESMKTWLFKSLTKLDLTNWIKFGKKTALALGIRTMLLIHLNLAPPFFDSMELNNTLAPTTLYLIVG